MKQKKYPVTNIGTALILTVFIILALVTFAVLSMINTKHDYQFTEKIAERTSSYYEASNEAVSILSQVDEIARSCYQENQGEYYQEVSKCLEHVTGITVDASSTDCHILYSIPISESQALDVETEVLYPTASGDPYYTVHKWQEVSTKEWNADAKLNVLN